MLIAAEFRKGMIKAGIWPLDHPRSKGAVCAELEASYLMMCIIS